MMMRRNKVIINVLSLATALGIIIGLAGTKEESRNNKIGHCFDVAYDPVQNRLFAVAGYQGMHVFNVSDGNLSFVTTVYDEGYYRNLKISGNRAFIADTSRGFIIYNISKQVPVMSWKWKEAETKTRGFGIHVEGNLAYLAQGMVDKNDIKLGRAGLYIFDISAPDSPKLIGRCKTENAWDVWVCGKYAYVADFHGGLCVIDISSASEPREIARVKWQRKYPGAEIVRGERKFAYVAAGRRGLIVADVSNPLQPKVVGKYKSGRTGFAEGLCVKDKLVYLANGNEKKSDENGLLIIDTHNTSSPEVRGKCTFPGWVEGVCLGGNHIFIANWDSGVRSIDVSNPENPRLKDHFGPIIK